MLTASLKPPSKETNNMDAKHNLKSLSGINPRTARKLFAKLSAEFEGVSWTVFRRWAGRDLRCFAEDSRWIAGDLLRGFFAEHEACIGMRFVALYDAKAHRPSDSAYQTPKRTSKKRNGGGGSGNGSANVADFTRRASALRERILRALSQTEDRTAQLREALGLAEASIAQLGEGS